MLRLPFQQRYQVIFQAQHQTGMRREVLSQNSITKITHKTERKCVKHSLVFITIKPIFQMLLFNDKSNNDFVSQ